jgi:hypothetical protein
VTCLDKSRTIWISLTLFLLSWNGSRALFAGPDTIFHAYDGVQYQLLARNRLLGHYEVGDSAHTVRSEGNHPMWRPALVWMIEGLARLMGSVQSAAILTSVVGTTLLEILMLWLAYRCLGWGVCLACLAVLVSPLITGMHFVLMAIGQGPEPWAGASLLAGLACLLEAREAPTARRAGTWAILAGGTAGLAEWFRTGNLLLFAGPCAVYALAALCRRDYRRLGLSAAALAMFLLTSGISERLVSSPVDKTTANLWASLLEHQGLQETVQDPQRGAVIFYMEGLKLAPGNREAYYDYIVRAAQGMSLLAFLSERGNEIGQQYVANLIDMTSGGARGLRYYLGSVLLLCLAGQLVVSVLRRHDEAVDCLALAAGPLLFFLGPLVLLRGDQPVHYLSVGLPMLLIVAAAGLVAGGRACLPILASRCPALSRRYREAPVLVAALLFVPFIVLSVTFFHGTLRTLQAGHSECAAAHAELDALPLQGRRVACRNMSWFVDRPVETVLLPYADVADIEQYAQAQRLDGILIWAKEKHLFFRLTPHGSVEAFEDALRQSQSFGTVHVAGDWHWYPVRRPEPGESEFR